ncbi:MAG TPA: helix-turn-helix domain-containing protein [Anaerolineales bacterium]
MRTSRQRVLEYVQSQRIVAAADIRRALSMTAANARHHLAILEQQGLVEVVGKRPSKGKGRPAALYSLSQGALGHNLDRLAAALLDEALGGQPPESQGRLLRHLSGKLAGENVGPGGQERPASLTQRLYQAVQRLNEMRYQARWEAHAQAPRIILGHCPYASILPEHPELCALDAALLENLLEAPATQAAKLAPDPRGGRYCLFLVKLAGR